MKIQEKWKLTRLFFQHQFPSASVLFIHNTNNFNAGREVHLLKGKFGLINREENFPKKFKTTFLQKEDENRRTGFHRSYTFLNTGLIS